MATTARIAEGAPPIRSGRRWGPWTYHKRAHCLVYQGGPYAGAYDIPLAECVEYGRAMGWALHMANKNWISASDLGFLVRALRDINDWHSW